MQIEINDRIETMGIFPVYGTVTDRRYGWVSVEWDKPHDFGVTNWLPICLVKKSDSTIPGDISKPNALHFTLNGVRHTAHIEKDSGHKNDGVTNAILNGIQELRKC